MSCYLRTGLYFTFLCFHEFSRVSTHLLVGHIWCQLYNFAVSSCQLVKSEVKRKKARKRPRSYFREITQQVYEEITFGICSSDLATTLETQIIEIDYTGADIEIKRRNHVMKRVIPPTTYFSCHETKQDRDAAWLAPLFCISVTFKQRRCIMHRTFKFRLLEQFAQRFDNYPITRNCSGAHVSSPMRTI